MKKILVLSAVCLFAGNTVVYSQSAYQLVKNTPQFTIQSTSIKLVSRHLKAPLSSSSLAKHVSELRVPIFTNTYAQGTLLDVSPKKIIIPEIHIISSFPISVLRNPSSLWGSYRYLRVLTSLSRESGSVHPQYIDEWNKIFQVSGYNGVHHIVNKSTLKVIYHELKQEAAAKKQVWTISLEDLQNNTPASLHPFHGKPEYSGFFHNMDRQLLLYREGGVRAIITDYFRELAKFHEMYPEEAPYIPQQVVNNTVLEAKLWCETFGLKWK